MENNAKEVNRPLDKEELNQEREEKVAGGFCAATNTAAFNTAAINTAAFINTSAAGPASAGGRAAKLEQAGARSFIGSVCRNS